ncbi:MAG TPA: hypothetical protein ENN73_02255 [Firmicutes bacterium]|nr:hypothetical protein [Bacillota bacterium]
MTCIFCGTKYFLDDAKEVDFKNPDGIIPFKSNESDVRSSLLNWLKTSRFIPDDIEKITVTSVSGVYVPLYLLKVKYSVDWTATSIYFIKETYETFEIDSSGQRSSYPVTKTKKVEKYRPSSGRGNLIYEHIYVLSRGHPGDTGICENLFKKYEKDLSSFTEGQVKQHQLEPFSKIPKDELSSLETVFSEKIEKDIGKTIPGDRYKELHWSIDDTEIKESRYYIPVWIINYEYGTETFQAFLDGVDLKIGSGSVPEDSDKVEQARQEEEEKRLAAEHEKDGIYREYKDMRKYANFAYVIIVIYFLALLFFERLFYRHYYWNMIPVRSYLIMHAVGLIGFIIFYKITEAVRKKILRDSDIFLRDKLPGSRPERMPKSISVIIKYIYVIFLIYSLFLVFKVEQRKGFPQNFLIKLRSYATEKR